MISPPNTFDPPFRASVGIETFSVSPEFHSMALAYRPVQCRRNVLNCGCFDREKKSKSQKGGGGAILFLPDSRVPLVQFFFGFKWRASIGIYRSY